MKDQIYESVYFVWMLFWFWVILSAFAACSSQPIVRVQYVTVKSYLPIPATLTAPIAVDLTGQTYGEGLGSLRAGLETCNGQLTSIATLKPPPTL